MTRDQFINKRQDSWGRFEMLLTLAEKKRTPQLLSGDELAEFSALYRSLCFDLSLVQSRDWGTSMSRYLNNLVARGHNCLYRSQPGSLSAMVRFIAADFPRLLRANIAYFWVALVLSVAPGAIAGYIVAHDPSQAGRIMPGEAQAMMEEMYSQSIAEQERPDNMEGMMAGFYVRNNIGISFKCFALGAFAGIGTMMVLVYNSLFLGTVTGLLIGKGHWGNFLEFVIGHGSFELTAIVVSGAAGLIIGHALVHPGNMTRWDALKMRGLVAVKIALGAAAMLFIAALIEGFWSPSTIPRDVKIVVGAGLWLVVVLYLALAGRTTRADRSGLTPAERSAVA